MTTVYKLTDQKMQTHGGYQWVLGEWHEKSGEGELCGPGWLIRYWVWAQWKDGKWRIET